MSPMQSGRHFPVVPFALLVVLLVAGSAGCSSSSPSEGRYWRLYDSRSDPKGTYIVMTLSHGKNPDKEETELWDSGGCLEYRVNVRVFDKVDRWYVYELNEWKTVLGLRESKLYLVTDPPGRAYQGASEYARPEDVLLDGPKPTAGPVESDRSLRDYPVKVEWQVIASEGYNWLPDGDSRIALSGSRALASDEKPATMRITLCEPDLVKLLDYPAQRFTTMFRLTPAGWSDASRLVEARVVAWSRVPLTRDRIVEALKKLKKAPPAIEPSVTKPASGKDR